MSFKQFSPEAFVCVVILSVTIFIWLSSIWFLYNREHLLSKTRVYFLYPLWFLMASHCSQGMYVRVSGPSCHIETPLGLYEWCLWYSTPQQGSSWFYPSGDYPWTSPLLLEYLRICLVICLLLCNCCLVCLFPHHLLKTCIYFKWIHINFTYPGATMCHFSACIEYIMILPR